MAKELLTVIQPPVHGINMAVDEQHLGELEALDINGFELDEYGTLCVPYPDKDLGALAGTVLGAAVFYRGESNIPQMIVHLNDGSIRYSTDYLTTTGSATWTTIATGLSTTNGFCFCTAFGYMWMSNTANGLRRWDGTTHTAYGAVPKFSHLALWKDTLWGTGDTANPDRVYRSDPGDGTTWPALNFVDINKGSGWPNEALLGTDAGMVVFKKNMIHVIYDPVEYSNRLVDDSKGCVNFRTIVNYRGQVYYLSPYGFAKFYGDAPGPIVSDKISPIFDGEAGMWGLASSGPYGPKAWVFENAIHISNWTQAWVVMYYPELPEAPWLFQFGDYNVKTVGVPVVNVNAAGSIHGLYTFDQVGTSNIYRRYDETGTADIAATWSSRWFDFDDPFSEKLIYEVQAITRGKVTLAFERDGYSTEAISGVAPTILGTTPDDTIFTQNYFDVEVYGRSFRLKMTATDRVTNQSRAVADFLDVGRPFTLGRYQAAISSVRIRARRLGSRMR